MMLFHMLIIFKILLGCNVNQYCMTHLSFVSLLFQIENEHLNKNKLETKETIYDHACPSARMGRRIKGKTDKMPC